MRDNQRDVRRRVFHGTLTYPGKTPGVSCTVHELGGNGCRIRVVTTRGVPDEFVLSIAAGAMIESCHVSQRSNKHLSVTFGAVDQLDAGQVSNAATTH